MSGWLHGVRIRKNFKSREEAAAEKAALEIAAEQATSGLRTVTTCLTTEQVREAEAAFHRVEGRPLALTGYLDFALANYRGPASTMNAAPQATQRGRGGQFFLRERFTNANNDKSSGIAFLEAWACLLFRG